MTHQPVDQEALESRLRTDPHLAEIAECLGSVECWVVGGWVRDRALDREPPDLDLVVPGAEAAKKAAATLGAAWRTTPRLLGKPERAVWRLTGPRCKVEIWPMESGDLEADVLRRDFTCNALFWRLPKGPLLDYTGGYEDIKNRRIKAISRNNLGADPVRLLRAVRLVATLRGFSLDPRTMSWIADLAPALVHAPRERVGAELLALALAPWAATGLRECATLGLLETAGPRTQPADFNASLDTLARLAGVEPHPAPASVTHNRPQAVLAWLASGWPVSTPKDLAAFAWPRDLARSVAIAASRNDEACEVVSRNPAERREFINRCGHAFPTVLALAAGNDVAGGGCPQPWRRWWRQWVRSGPTILEPKPLLDASEVTIVTNVEPGPRLGQILKDLERVTVRREIRTPAGARRWLRHYSDGASSEVSPSA
ncbi:MAG: CCA tRNA nucleotidyltransferase [Acidobacteria bacterium]|nr:CCA tRNA nucleotidyltransferase [Acidobacteriota bacterium]